MPTRANVVPPSLVNELAEVKRRLAAIERAPAQVNKFDRYPQVEWAAQGRPQVGGNIWSSFGIANVTGLVFDRVEAKFITDWLISGKREAEVRLAAFRHTGNAQREIVSASGVFNLTGLATRQVGVVVMRWIHQIPYGWDYTDDTTIYTIELQHRYKKGPEKWDPNRLQIFGMWKREKDKPASDSGGTEVGGGRWVTYQAGSDRSPIGYVDIPVERPADNDVFGSYSLSAMHYCVGLPAERIPEATANGWAWARGTNSSWGRGPDLNEPHFSV
ncbi:hypothetical protein [Streptomyces sp. MNP-20]|uniref:hypothetical protein n=1 Tax=Streptomyces sp. MNP-20 TaxID=2721165 RepID=UPI001555B7D4|nr:hypothetical protein [Streptomyces sp. MNP-20]